MGSCPPSSSGKLFGWGVYYRAARHVSCLLYYYYLCLMIRRRLSRLWRGDEVSNLSLSSVTLYGWRPPHIQASRSNSVQPRLFPHHGHTLVFQHLSSLVMPNQRESTVERVRENEEERGQHLYKKSLAHFFFFS